MGPISLKKTEAKNESNTYLFGYGIGVVGEAGSLTDKLKALGHTEATVPSRTKLNLYNGFACCGTAIIGNFYCGYGTGERAAAIESYMKCIEFACYTLRNAYKKGLVYATVRVNQEDNRILTALLRSGFKIKSYWMNPNSGNAVISLEKILATDHEAHIGQLVEQYK